MFVCIIAYLQNKLSDTIKFEEFKEFDFIGILTNQDCEIKFENV